MSESLPIEYPEDFDHPAKIDIEKLLNLSEEEAGVVSGTAFSAVTGIVKQHHTESVQISARPIPSAQELAEYEQVCEGAADRIIKMAEQQSEHRRKMESKMLDAAIESDKVEAKNEFRLGRLGSIFAFLICAGIVGAGAFCLYHGNNIAGFVSLIAGLVPIASIFLYSNRRSRQSDEDSSEGQSLIDACENESADLTKVE